MKNDTQQGRTAPRTETTARKPWTTMEALNAGGMENAISSTDTNSYRSTQSNGSSVYNSQRQILNDMHQLDVVTRGPQRQQLSTSQTAMSSNRLGATEYRPATLAVASQKSTLQQRDSTLETSSDNSSATDINPQERTKSGGCFCLQRTVIALLALLLLAGGGGAVYYFMVYSKSEENSASLVATPAPAPKQAETEPEKLPVAPVDSRSSPRPTIFPTLPSKAPSLATELTSKPPLQESLSPSIAASSLPTFLATTAPSLPTLSDPVFPKIDLGVTDHVTTFYAIGDVPYSTQQAEEIEVQIRNIPSDAEFVIHVGDLRNYDVNNPLCLEEEFILAADIFKQSPVPVFVIIGDNEWIDCSNPEEGLGFWKKHFLEFDKRYWNHTFDVVRQPGRAYNFAFVNKKTLFVGLNIVGLPVHDALEWEVRLTEEVEWTKALIRQYSATIGETGRVVIFGHANPTSAHFHFFGPLDTFLSQELNNQMPVLYLNGDKHEWSYDPAFQGVESLLRIMVTGGSSEPPLKMKVVANGQSTSTGNAFLHYR
ncbi:hypothetical protein FisN_21Hh164 [Fistulifera solaris]|uniref:Uncharacterized protein n=1 Tax=Fistulifera solaris TaxID=1519565 RepID=A0A1Z5JS89_FISSO|nr:hypothetical protein FisN_21Hh164 [Fistulifera solaris]|eukprot:GAX16722.1 hypothetical protein FisN_21Hh164 [Fistulifera solaris]